MGRGESSMPSVVTSSRRVLPDMARVSPWRVAPTRAKSASNQCAALTGVATRDAYFFALSFAALSNPTNSGCGLMGLDRNSGWN